VNLDIERAAAALRAGGLVAFPTETVYGLGADAASRAALARLYAAKGRPTSHPVIVHVPRGADLGRWAARVPAAAERLAERFWPGPLTLVLDRAARVPDEVTGGQPTVALRVPDHPIALALLGAFGDGVAAPSANRFGRLSPTRAEHVRAELGDLVDVVLDGGPCRVGVESTIVALVGERPLVLRPGAILAGELAEVLGELPRTPDVAARAVGELPRAPGGLPSHYAPATPLELLTADELPARVAALLRRGERVAVLARGSAPAPLADAEAPGGSLVWLRAPDAADAYARALYATLRGLDDGKHSRIIVETVPAGARWLAVADRLRRAAH
jgi:L-threonylcarbamoyladenylate synthase